MSYRLCPTSTAGLTKFKGCIAVGVVFTWARLGLTDPPTKSLPKALRFEELLLRLSDGLLQTRDEAAKSILDMGAKALPRLQNARQSSDPELRRRIEELIPQLERNLLL